MAFYDTEHCLWCNADLHDASQWGHVVECRCGVRYDKELLRTANREEWESIRRRDDSWRVERDGHDVIITDLDAQAAIRGDG